MSRIGALILAVVLVLPAVASADQPSCELAKRIASDGAVSDLFGQHVSLSGEPIFSNGPKWFTNSMLTTFLVDIFLIVVAVFATHSMKMIPTGVQNFMEMQKQKKRSGGGQQGSGPKPKKPRGPRTGG